MLQCDGCQGFLPRGSTACPNCGRMHVDRMRGTRALVVAGMGLAAACSSVFTPHVLYGPVVVHCSDTFCAPDAGVGISSVCEVADSGEYETCCGDAGIISGIGCAPDEEDGG